MAKNSGCTWAMQIVAIKALSKQLVMTYVEYCNNLVPFFSMSVLLLDQRDNSEVRYLMKIICSRMQMLLLVRQSELNLPLIVKERKQFRSKLRLTWSCILKVFTACLIHSGGKFSH